MKGLYDAQAPMCPVCQAILRPGELQDHMEQELTKLAQLQIRYQYLVTNDFDSFTNLYSTYLFHFLHLSICHFLLVLQPSLSILFSFQVIINVDRFHS